MVEEKDMIGVKDELGELTENQYLETAKKDLDTIKQSIELSENQLDRYTKQVERIEKIWEIQLAPGNFRPTNPKMVFEQSEEFWKLQEQEQWDKIREQRQVHKGTFERLKREIKNSKRELKEKRDFIKKLGGKNE